VFIGHSLQGSLAVASNPDISQDFPSLLRDQPRPSNCNNRMSNG
jgi:hypothetical protein